MPRSGNVTGIDGLFFASCWKYLIPFGDKCCIESPILRYKPSIPVTFPTALRDLSYHRKDLGLSVHKWVVYKSRAVGNT
jgi:hypothetical protein